MSILSEPSKHPLPALLRELCFGRPAAQQKLLMWLANLIEVNGCGQKTMDEIADELGDPADWWKQDGDPS